MKKKQGNGELSTDFISYENARENKFIMNFEFNLILGFFQKA